MPCKGVLCNIDELNLELTLNCGQVFRWVSTTTDCYRGVVGNYIIDLINDRSNGLVRWICNNHDDGDAVLGVLDAYFRLKTHKATDLYKYWSSVDEHFSSCSKHLQGLRCIAQDPVECLFSFICSQNNNISRITQLINALCREYGHKIEYDDGDGITYYSFPSLSALTTMSEERLSELKFGYRSRYLVEAAKQLAEAGGEQHLRDLSIQGVESSRTFLTSLMGVGRKVADCCLLFDKPGSLKPGDVDFIQKFYVKLFGPAAGWAHSVLFAADLPRWNVSFDNEENTIKKIKKMTDR